ncbi:hypothetical protein RHMOL_Rhmol09G0101700 [Rhododendron molle]|uniref:Uncharacterized protein n=1 Tax=Rhododendron molle TaxID=49168 RepID=A0ACC0MCX1_RHOML|nr:hypothetical protein RHMOL_Rhmol09G0101700 [Rhododendron molle]
MYPNKRSTVHLSYLPALRDLRTTSWFDWGEPALGACYGFYGRVLTRSEGDYWVLESVGVVGLQGIEDVPSREQLQRGKDAAACHDMGAVAHCYCFNVVADIPCLGCLNGMQVEWDPWVSADPELEYLAWSRVVAVSRVLLESAFGWQ